MSGGLVAFVPVSLTQLVVMVTISRALFRLFVLSIPYLQPRAVCVGIKRRESRGGQTRILERGEGRETQGEARRGRERGSSSINVLEVR